MSTKNLLAFYIGAMMYSEMIQKIKINGLISKETLYELGSKPPYHRYINIKEEPMLNPACISVGINGKSLRDNRTDVFIYQYRKLEELYGKPFTSEQIHKLCNQLRSIGIQAVDGEIDLTGASEYDSVVMFVYLDEIYISTFKKVNLFISPETLNQLHDELPSKETVKASFQMERLDKIIEDTKEKVQDRKINFREFL